MTMARRLPKIVGLALCAAVIGLFTTALGFAADTEAAGNAIAIVDFNYVDTSGEARDQRAEHEARLSVFMNALKDDLAAGGKFRIIVPACRPDPCSRSSGRELSEAARAAGADLLLVGGIHKMSTLVQWARAEVIDLRSGRIVLDKLFTFRGDTDQAWKRAEAFISNALISLAPSHEADGK
jgi:hypothetical protein